jgi:hypothetical protein
MIISQELQLILVHKRTLQDQLFQVRVFMFQTVFFISISSTGNGGALCCTSATSFLVEFSSFISCKTSSGEGGAVYFANSGGQSVLHGVCGYDCFANQHYQFYRSEVKDDASYKNYVNYSSIARCVNENSNSHHTLLLYKGKNCCSSVNVSINKCYYRSGIYCYPSSSNYVTCSFTYSSFTDNIATGYTCIFLWKSGEKYEMKSCNILRNTQPLGNEEGTIYTSGNLMIEDSCILENKATYIFSQYSSYTITLSNCTIDSTSNNGYLTTQNTVTKSFILALKHMSTKNYNSEYDSVGTLTPIAQTPSSTKKQKLYCTCPQVNFVSLTCVFVFNFIHPDSFSYL